MGQATSNKGALMNKNNKLRKKILEIWNVSTMDGKNLKVRQHVDLTKMSSV